MKNVAQTLRKTSRGKRSAEDLKRYVFPLPEQLIGLEVEVDIPERGDQLPVPFRWPEQFAPYWNKIRDGSLRNGNEFVLAAPLSGDMLSDAICRLFAGGTSIYRTTTGSTHIHVDMLEDETPIASVQVLVLLLFMLEGAIFAACDPGREWCGYTNKLSSAPDSLLGSVLNCDLSESPDLFLDAISGHQSQAIGRYYGLNLQALAKYGSVEFRYFPTATNADELASWVTMVQMFKKAALDIGTVSNLQEVVENESRYNDLIASYFGPWLDAFMKEVPHYKAIASFQKALATAASQQCRASNGRWSDEFDPRAITDNKVYSKLIKKRKAVRAQLELLVSNDLDPTPSAVLEGNVLLANGHLYLPIPNSQGRPNWGNLAGHSPTTLAMKLSAEYMQKALTTLRANQHSAPVRAERYARRAMDSFTVGISLLERTIEYQQAAAPRPVRVSYDEAVPAPAYQEYNLEDEILRVQEAMSPARTTAYGEWVVTHGPNRENPFAVSAEQPRQVQQAASESYNPPSEDPEEFE